MKNILIGDGMRLLKLVFVAVFLLLLTGCLSKPSISGDATPSSSSATNEATNVVQAESDDSQSNSFDEDDVGESLEDSSIEEELEEAAEEVLEDDVDEILAEDETTLDESLEDEVIEDQEEIEAATQDLALDDTDMGLDVDLGAEAQEAVEEAEDTLESDAADADLPDSDAQSLDVMDDGSLSPLEKTAIYFGFDRYDLNDKMLERVKGIAVEFMDNERDLTLKIEGNADERGTDEYNYALALRRAQSVKNALVNYGLNADKINLVSYGESNPVCEEQTRACYSKNRRVNFKILP